MYAEFGSKQGLFEASLERYSEENLSRVLAPLEDENAELDVIRSAFEGYASASEGSYRGLGCLMCNTAAERAALDPASGRYVARHLERLRLAFSTVLNRAQSKGQLDSSVNTEDMAEFLTTSLIGIAACVRAEAPSEQLWASARVMGNYIDAQRA